MAQIQNPVTLNATGATLLNAAGANLSPDGIALSITVTGTNSLVLAQNTAPPGAAVSLSNVAYLNGSLVPQSAGTAITASGVYYILPANGSLDLWGTNTWTSGSVVVRVSAASLGNAGSGGPVSAGDVEPGTFGANVGSVGDYAVPDDFTVADQLTTSGTSTELSQAATTAAVNVGAGTNSGATVLRIRGAAGQTRTLSWRTGAAAAGDRWAAVASAASEAGANAGSDWSLNAYDDTGALIDQPLFLVRAANGAIYTSAGRSVTLGGAPGGATTATRGTKAVTAIPNNTATTVLTITVPNTAQRAVVRVTAQGALGAGGAIGAGEATASNSYDIGIVRTAGVNAVANISSAYGATACAVAGAATCTAALTVAAVSGAVGATNTFSVQITVVRSGGSSDNHTATLEYTVLNTGASGITVA
jgi:hypothetical protein